MTEYIKLPNDTTTHVENALRDGYYIEAIQILHAKLEWYLRLLLMTAGHTETSVRYNETWDLTYDFSLNHACKALFIVGKISKEECSVILTLNRTRNQIIHKLFHDPYDKEWLGVPRNEFDLIVSDTRHILEILDHRLSIAFGAIIDKDTK